MPPKARLTPVSGRVSPLVLQGQPVAPFHSQSFQL